MLGQLERVLWRCVCRLWSYHESHPWPGPARLNVYNYTGANLPPIKPVGGGDGGGGTGSSTLLSPVTTGLPKGWRYNACWV